MEGSRSGDFAEVPVPEGYGRFLLGQLFEPWAAELITRAELQTGCRVLDVASGLGPVARLAAAAAGPAGRVVASDISAAMLAAAAARPAPPGRAPIEYLQCLVSAITADDDSVDTVLCQHGLQFFPTAGMVASLLGWLVWKDAYAVSVASWASKIWPASMPMDGEVPGDFEADQAV